MHAKQRLRVALAPGSFHHRLKGQKRRALRVEHGKDAQGGVFNAVDPILSGAFVRKLPHQFFERLHLALKTEALASESNLIGQAELASS